MKVMMLASGKSYHATRWANALVERGIGIIFVSVHALVRPLDDRVIHVDLGGNGRIAYLTSLNRLRHLIKQHAPDLVHSHSAGGYALMGAMCGFKPWIVSVYGADVYEVPGKSVFHHVAVGELLKRADRLLSTSHAMADRVAVEYPFLPPATVTPFGVDTDRFRMSEKNKLRSVMRIALVKKLEVKYGVDILIETFQNVANDQRLPIELHIVGEGSKREELEAQAIQTSCADRIFFHGALPNSDVPAFLNSCDLFVVPSRFESESFGVAAVEAMACGLPVIASDVGGLPEVVQHGLTGLIVPKEDVEALADAIMLLATDSDLRQTYGEAARWRVERLYDWRRNVEQMIEVYRATLDHSNGSEYSE